MSIYKVAGRKESRLIGHIHFTKKHHRRRRHFTEYAGDSAKNCQEDAEASLTT